MGDKEMLSVKRLIYVLLIVVVVSAVFMVYNINEERAKNIQIKNLEIEMPEFTASEPVDPAEKPRVSLLGDPEKDIGRTCVFLCSEDAKYISGETITMQGGSGLRP